MVRRFSIELDSERGAALLVVLAAGAVLAMLAVLILNAGRRTAAEDISAENAARAEAAAEAGLAYAIAGLSAPDIASRWAIGSEERTLSIDGFLITVRIEDELGKIDLNAADVTLLARLLSAAGASDAEARELAAAIDARRRPHADNAEALPGLPIGPFLRVDELLLLPGMSDALYVRFAPAMTVYAHRPMADLESAPALVLMAVQGLDARAAEAVVAARPPRTLVQLQGRPITIDVRVTSYSPRRNLSGKSRDALRVADTLVSSEWVASPQRRTIILTDGPGRPYLTAGSE